MSKTSFKKTFLTLFFVMALLSLSFLFVSCGNSKAAMKDGFIQLSVQEAVYTGQEIKPVVEVKNGKKTYVQGTDFVVFYANNINVGEAKVVISALNSSKKLKGRIEKTFSIVKRNLNDTTIDVESLTFSGNPNALPNVLVKVGEKEIPKSNYSLSITGGYPDTENTITISATENSNLLGSVTQNFVVNYMNLSDASIVVARSTYNSLPQTPNFSVKVGEFEIPQEVVANFEKTYSNNILPTTVAQLNITVTQPNHYFAQNATKQIYFEIEKANIAEVAEVNPIADKTYDGTTAHQVLPEVYAFNNLLTQNEDYVVLYYRDEQQIVQDGQFVDGGHITIRLLGKNCFCGSLDTTYFIRGIDISQDPNLIVTIDDQILEFNGNAQTPNAQIMLGETQIYSYDISYSNNINAGNNTAVATITFFGNYDGTVQKTFSIAQKSINEFLLTLENNSITYVPNQVNLVCSVQEFENTVALVLNRDYVLEFENTDGVTTPQNPATVKAIGIGNYFGQTSTQTFSILPLAINENMIGGFVSELSFDGTDKTQNITLTHLGQEIPSTNYDITYYSNYQNQTVAVDFVSAEQTIYMAITPKNNLNGETIVLTYNINKGILNDQDVVVTLNNNAFEFDGTPKTPSVTQVLFKGHELDSSNYDTSIENNINAGMARVVISGKQNTQGSMVHTFTITPQNITSVGGQITFKPDSTYNKNVQNLVPTVEETNLFTQNDYGISYYKIENGEKIRLSGDEIINISNAGTYEIEVFGTRNYSGSISHTTIIQKIQNVFETPLQITSWEYGQQPSIQCAAEFGEVKLLFANANSTEFSQVVPTKVGSYLCKAEISESTNYFGLACICPFEIKKCNLSSEYTPAEIIIESLTLNGENIENIVIKLLLTNTILDSNHFSHTQTYENGTINVNLTAKNTSNLIEGEFSKSFAIKNFATLSINCQNSYVFGDIVNVVVNADEGITPVCKIFKKLGTALIEVNNLTALDCGEYVVVAKVFENNLSYEKVIQKEFVVTPKVYNSNFEITGISNTHYSGQNTLLNHAIYNDTQTLLVENKDYVLSVVGDTINAADTDVVVTITFVGNYSGETTKSYRIFKKIIIANTNIKTAYTGLVIPNNIMFDEDFEEGTDYDVLYFTDEARQNPATNEDKTNVGILYGLIKSNNPNIEDCTFTFEITKAQNKFLDELFVSDFEFGDEITKPTVNAKFGEVKIYYATYNKDNKTYGEFLEWTNEQKPTAFGKYIAKAEVAASANYDKITSSSVMFEIKRQEILRANVEVSQTEFTYNGTNQLPTIVVKDKFGNTLTFKTHYNVRYFVPAQEGRQPVMSNTIIERGTYILNITAKSGTNYSTQNEINIIFEII